MKYKILNYLMENDLEDLEQIKISEKDTLVIKLNYYFDDLEKEGAEAYADEECVEGKDSYEYYEDYVIPYLSDIAVDNVDDIVRDIAEELDLEYQLLSFDIDLEDYDMNSFVVAFYERDKEFELEDYITEII
ncbi:hypothetical protein C3495_04510 [Clostridiaceae bacterium 14S0207]|nr:hypothetical protein C3495_04510 [Clostridiaceae bacterium 14S0207]